MPSAKEKYLSFSPPCTNIGISITPLTLTTPFCAELLTAAYTANPRSAYIIPKLSLLSTIVYTYSTKDTNIKGLIISSSFIGILLSITTTL